MSDHGNENEKSSTPDAQESSKAERINEVLKSAKLKTYSQEDLDLIKEKDKPLYDKFLALDKGEEGVDLGQNLTETIAKLDSELAKHEKTSGSLKTTADSTYDTSKPATYTEKLTHDTSKPVTFVDLKDSEKTAPESAEKAEDSEISYFERRVHDFQITDEEFAKMLESVKENGLPDRAGYEWIDSGDDKESAENILKLSDGKIANFVKVLQSAKENGTYAYETEEEYREYSYDELIKNYADFLILAVPRYLNFDPKKLDKKQKPIELQWEEDRTEAVKKLNEVRMSPEQWKYMIEDLSARGLRDYTGVPTSEYFLEKYPDQDTLNKYLKTDLSDKPEVDRSGQHSTAVFILTAINQYYPKGAPKEYKRHIEEAIPLKEAPKLTEEPIEITADITRLNIIDLKDPEEKEPYKEKFITAIVEYLEGYGYHPKYGYGLDQIKDDVKNAIFEEGRDLPRVVDEFFEYTGDEDPFKQNEGENKIRILSEEVQDQYDRENPVKDPAKEEKSKKEDPAKTTTDGGGEYGADAGGSGSGAGGSGAGTDVPSSDDDTEFVPDADAPTPDAQGGEAVRVIGFTDESAKSKVPTLAEREKGLRSHDESLNILNDLAKWGFKANDKRNFKNRIEQNLKEKYKRDYGDHLQIRLKNIDVVDGVASIGFMVLGEKNTDMAGHLDGFVLKGFAKDSADKTAKGMKKIGESEIKDSEANREAVKKLFQKSIFNGIFEPLVLDQTLISETKEVGKDPVLERLQEYVKDTYLDADKEKFIDKRRAAKYAGYRNRIQAEKALDENWDKLMSSDRYLTDDEKQKLKTLRNK